MPKPTPEPYSPAPYTEADHKRFLQGVVNGVFICSALYLAIAVGYLWVNGYTRGNPAIVEAVDKVSKAVGGEMP